MKNQTILPTPNFHKVCFYYVKLRQINLYFPEAFGKKIKAYTTYLFLLQSRSKNGERKHRLVWETSIPPKKNGTLSIFHNA